MPMSEMSRGKLPTKCPGCGSSSIKLSTGTLGDATKSGWSCSECNAFSFKEHDHPQITIGKRMSKNYDGVSAMDKSITHLPCNVQLGILRDRHRRLGIKCPQE